MTTTMTVSQLRANLAAALQAAERGDRVLVTRHGRVVVTLQAPEAAPLSAIELRAAQILAAFTAPAPADEPLPAVVPDSADFAATLVAAIRADRDGADRHKADRDEDPRAGAGQ